MGRLIKLGTHVRLPDGREATVVYNGLEGIGVKLGLHNPQPSDFAGTTGGLMRGDIPTDFNWFPDILLRDSNEWTPPKHELDGMECVCKESEVEIITKNRPTLRSSESSTLQQNGSETKTEDKE